MRVAHAGRAEEDDVLFALEKLENMQTLNLLAPHTWLKTEIEIVQSGHTTSSAANRR
jgi:hypothetical protein